MIGNRKNQSEKINFNGGRERNGSLDLCDFKQVSKQKNDAL